MPSKPLPSISELREAFDYFPDTGRIVWKPRDRNLSGVEAGHIDPSIGGYRRVNFRGAFILAHRLALAIVNGEWPDDEVDHINGDRSDNRISNLRCVSKLENLKNKSIYKNNRSGRIGVHWHKQHRKWAASIQCEGKRKMIGVFKNIEDAISAREAAESEMSFHKNHGRAK
jgi:hypothetical protein